MENQNFNDQVISEIALLEKLNIELPTLNRLRLEKSFPVVRLNVKTRVYLADEVLGWLKNHRVNL